MIPYGSQHISEEDIEAVLSVLRSGWLTQGQNLPAFESAVADYCGVDHAVAVSNGTAALHLACLALGLGQGGLLWTTPNTFVASANCAMYCGATVDFIDIDPQTYNLDLGVLRRKLEHARAKGVLPDIVLVVHFAGSPCDMQTIAELSDEYGFRVIEDASHALGASYSGTRIGDCQYSDCATFSFHPVKPITTAEGGMITTCSAELALKLQDLRSHGVTRDADRFVGDCVEPWYYEQLSLGFNYRMSDLQAALGISQIKQLDKFLKRREDIAQRYMDELSGLPLQLPTVSDGDRCGWHIFVVRVQSGTRNQVLKAMRERGIGVHLHYIPVYRQPHYSAMGHKPSDYPNMELYYEQAMTLPIFPGLTDTDQGEVINALKDVL